MGQLDQISRSIGALESSTTSLTSSFEKHVIDDDHRHLENITALQDIRQELRNLSLALSPLVSSVTQMKPIVDSYQISYWKKAGAISLAATALSVIAWVVTFALGSGFKLVSRLLGWH